MFYSSSLSTIYLCLGILAHSFVIWLVAYFSAQIVCGYFLYTGFRIIQILHINVDTTVKSRKSPSGITRMVIVSGICFTVAFIITLLLVTPLSYYGVVLPYTLGNIGSFVFLGVSLSQILVFDSKYSVSCCEQKFIIRYCNVPNWGFGKSHQQQLPKKILIGMCILGVLNLAKMKTTATHSMNKIV